MLIKHTFNAKDYAFVIVEHTSSITTHTPTSSLLYFVRSGYINISLGGLWNIGTDIYEGSCSTANNVSGIFYLRVGITHPPEVYVSHGSSRNNAFPLRCLAS